MDTVAVNYAHSIQPLLAMVEWHRSNMCQETSTVSAHQRSLIQQQQLHCLLFFVLQRAKGEPIVPCQLQHLMGDVEAIDTRLQLYILLGGNLYHRDQANRCYHLIGS